VDENLGLLCLLITSFLPATAAFLRAKFYFRFPRRSAQLLMMVPALAVMFGVLPLQWLVEDSLGLARNVRAMLGAAQYTAAAIAFIWKLTREQRGIAPEELARLTELNKRW